ncbi:Hydroxymethylglutaryl-CoA lyase [Apiospora marii]|uniref:hydroxymethylglutaryl-CoA lyase n=1 Tax=Apiospora marii TaxID=335849 RepID=A0ABR1RBB7_9PEZI
MASVRPMIQLAARQRVALRAPYLRCYATASDVKNPRPASNNHIRLVEVGPRDGLQNEKKSISRETKIELITRLAKAGLATVEAGSFVSPKWVPQMDGSSEIMKHLLGQRMSTVAPLTYSFLAPNVKGFENAKTILEEHAGSYLTQADALAGTDKTGRPAVELAVFAAATESFSQKNLNCDIATSLERFAPVIQGAKNMGLRARAYISVVLGCPFEGFDVDPHKVAEIATSLLEMGADEISLGDTTGMGTAPRTQELLRCMAAAGIRNEDIAMHFHDTTASGPSTAPWAASAAAPYSPGATGNVATENMVYFLESLGMDTGVDLDAVADIGDWITKEIGKPNDSAVGKAVLGMRRNATAKTA